MFKKVLFSCVALTLGIASLAAVGVTSAATISDGDLVKVATDSAVYLIQGSEKRVFPHANVYHSWGYPKDWSTVKTVSSSDLAAYTDGTAIPFRDGSMFRGTATSLEGKDKTAVFYVSGGKLRDIKSAEIYQALFSDPNWKYVTWVPDDLLSKFNYGLGTMIESSATYPNGAILQVGTTKYLVADGKVREFSAGAYEANGYDKSADVVPVYTVTSVTGYTAGTAIAAKETTLVTPGAGAAVVVVTGTGLTIVLASDTPGSATVVKTAARVPFTKVKATASSDGDVQFQLRVERTGLSNDTNIASVVFIDEETNLQLGNNKTLSSSNHRCMSDKITVKAGKTKSIIIAVNMADDSPATEVSSGELLALDVVEVITTATLNATLPLKGNQMTANDSIAVGTVTVNRGPSDPNLAGVATNKEIGTTNLELIALKILINSTEDYDIEGFEFTNYNGTCEDTDLDNLTLYVDEEKWATASSVSGEVYFNLKSKPITILKGKNKEIIMKGDIIDGSDRTIDFDVYDQIDVIAKGKTYGYYVTPTFTIDGTTTAAEPYFNAGNTYTIGVGKLSVSASNSIPVQNVAEGADGIALGSWTFSAKGEPIKISKLRIDFSFGTSTAGTYGSSTNFTNVAVYDEDGAAVTSMTDMTATTSVGGSADNDAYADGYISWTDSWTVPKGDHVYTVKGDLSTNYYNGDTLTALVVLSNGGLYTIKGENTNKTATVTPSSRISANLQTIKAGALAIRTSTGVPPVGTDVVKGSATQSVLCQIEYDAQDSGENVKITQVRFIIDARGGATAQYVDGLKLYDKTTGAEIVPDSYPDFDSTTANGSDTVDWALTGNPIIVPKKTIKILQLKGVVNSSETNGTSYAFANATSTSGAIARGVDTGESITETFGTTAFGSAVTVRGAGTLTGRYSAQTPAAGLILAGAKELTVAVFDLEAEYEDQDLSELALDLSPDNASTSPNDINAIYIYDSDGLIDSMAFTKATTTFYQLETKSNKLTIPAGETRQLTVKVDLNQVGKDKAGTTGHQVAFKIRAAGSLVAKGVISGASTEAIGTGTDAPNGATLYVRKGIPVFTEGKASDLTGLSGLGNTGTDVAVYQFTLGPKSDGGTVGMYRMTFDITTSTASATQCYLRDVTGGVTINASNTVKTFANNIPGFDGSAQNMIVFHFDTDGDATTNVNDKLEYQLSSAHTFQIRCSDVKEDGSNNNAARDSIRIKALSDITVQPGPKTAAEVETDADLSYVIWTDRADKDGHTSAANSTSTDEDWFNGYKVPGLSDATSTGIVLTDA